MLYHRLHVDCNKLHPCTCSSLFQRVFTYPWYASCAALLTTVVQLLKNSSSTPTTLAMPLSSCLLDHRLCLNHCCHPKLYDQYIYYGNRTKQCGQRARSWRRQTPTKNGTTSEYSTLGAGGDARNCNHISEPTAGDLREHTINIIASTGPKRLGTFTGKELEICQNQIYNLGKPSCPWTMSHNSVRTVFRPTAHVIPSPSVLFSVFVRALLKVVIHAWYQVSYRSGMKAETPRRLVEVEVSA